MIQSTKNTLWITVIIITSMMVNGCMINKVNLTDRKGVHDSIEVSYDNFKKVTDYSGPKGYVKEYTSGWDVYMECSFLIRAWKFDKHEKTSYQIYVTSVANRWRFHNGAYDSAGNRLDITEIDRSVGYCDHQLGCALKEIIGVNVSEKYLENHRSSGMEFKVSSRKGSDIIINIPANYIAVFLDKTKKGRR